MSKEFNPGAVITDFDNTLVRTHHFIRDHIQKTCMRIDVESPEDERIFQTLENNPPFEQIFEVLFDENANLVLTSYREDAMETHYHPTEGGTKFIKKLYEEGKKIIIVSNRTRKLKERLAQANYNPEWFMAILSPEKSKPDKEAYSEALERLEKQGIKRPSIYVMGDSPDDFLSCPDDLKENFVAILSGVNSAEEFEELGVSSSQMVESPSELLDRING